MSVPPFTFEGSTPGAFSSGSSEATDGRARRACRPPLRLGLYRSLGGRLFLDAAIRLRSTTDARLSLRATRVASLTAAAFVLALGNDRLATLLLHLPAGLGGSLLHRVDLSLRHEVTPSICGKRVMPSFEETETRAFLGRFDPWAAIVTRADAARAARSRSSRRLVGRNGRSDRPPSRAERRSRGRFHLEDAALSVDATVSRTGWLRGCMNRMFQRAA